MRFARVAAAATSLLVIGSAVSLGSAGAASTGVGTSTVSTSVLHVSLGSSGSLLDVRLLGDDAQSTRDAKTAAAPTAFSKLTALHTTSSVLNDPTTSAPLDLTLSALESRQPGGEAEVSKSSVDLANPGIPVVPGLGDIISGNLNLAKLTSAVDATSAKSTLTASLTNTKVAGALLDASALASTLSSTTTSTEASSTRAVDVDAITVLDLGALLDGLDINLLDLTPSQISDLLETLDVSIPNIDPASTLTDVIDAVSDEIDALQDAVLNNTGLTGTVQGVVDQLGLGGIIPQVDIDAITGTPVQQANQLIDTLQAALADVIASALSTLDATSLLKLDGVDVSVSTKAADTLAGTSSTVTGTIGAVNVGNLAVLPSIDILSTAEQINNAVTTVNATLSDVLGKISVPVTGGTVDLSKLVSIEVLKKTSSTATVNGYNTATGGLTGLSAKITPPTDLAALVTAIKAAAGTDSAAALIEGLTGSTAGIPDLSSAMSDLEATLGTGIQALQGGATVNVVEVMGVSEFRAVGTTSTSGPTLPATGNGSARLAALGLLLVALGLGLGRWFSMPVPAFVRRRF